MIGVADLGLGPLRGRGLDHAVWHADHAGLAVEFEEHFDLAILIVSPMAWQRISSVLPGSISAVISSPGSIP